MGGCSGRSRAAWWSRLGVRRPDESWRRQWEVVAAAALVPEEEEEEKRVRGGAGPDL